MADVREVSLDAKSRSKDQRASRPVVSSAAASGQPTCEPNRQLEVHLKIRLQTMETLLDVITTVARVGGSIQSVTASECVVDLVVSAREPVSLRLPKLIDQLVTVLSVSKLP